MSREFIFAGDELKSVDPLKAGKWKKYLDLKAAFYLSYVSSILQALVTERKQYTVKCLVLKEIVWRKNTSFEISEPLKPEPLLKSFKASHLRKSLLSSTRRCWNTQSLIYVFPWEDICLKFLHSHIFFILLIFVLQILIRGGCVEFKAQMYQGPPPLPRFRFTIISL